MKFRIFGLVAIAAFAVSCVLGSTQSLAQNAYITNLASSNVSVIDTASNTVVATISLPFPGAVAVAPDGSKVYIGNSGVSGPAGSVIDTATNTVTATIFVQPGAERAGERDGEKAVVRRPALSGNQRNIG